MEELINKIKKLESELEDLRNLVYKKTGSGTNDLKPANYKSSDGSPGKTETVTLAGTTTLIFKNGLYISKT